MDVQPHKFVEKVGISSIYMTAGVILSLGLMFAKSGKGVLILIPIAPILLCMLFFMMLKTPDAKIIKIAKEIDKEIIFAGKFMIIELKSGVSLYQVLNNIAQNYGGVGKYFKKIVQDIDLGTETQEAISNAIIANPSDNFRKVMWQLSNSLNTGADVSISLNTVLDQINKNQMIEVEKYGKKLNPIATFYLMLAVVLPSLGMVMGVVMASFINLKINMVGFVFIAFGFAFFQFMFYAVIKTNRPAVEM
jgi:pilus assembly protein TadC